MVSGDGISACCKGKREIAGGFHWRYVERQSRYNKPAPKPIKKKDWFRFE